MEYNYEKLSHVLGSGMSGGGYYIHLEKDAKNNKEILIPVSEVRASIVPADSNESGYLLIKDEKYGLKNDANKNPMLFLFEKESHSFESLLGSLSEEIMRLQIAAVYCESEGFQHAIRKRFNGKVRVPRQIPYVDNLDYSKIMVDEWLRDKSIEIPKGTIISSQLKKTTNDYLPPAFHALRLILGGFVSHSPRQGGPREVVTVDPDGWT